MLNLNIGLLGHVDSGKTSLAKALSQTASTAAFDKSPQSQTRGITLDLGFSACEVNASTPGCASILSAAGLEKVECTLVDCPGHASLIRTVVGGSQIIDVIVLLVDATKGIQSQTAECLVLGEVLAKPLVVVINKVDAVQGRDEAERRLLLDKLRKKLASTFAKTRWPLVPMVEVSAAPRATDDAKALDIPPVNTTAVLPAVLGVVDLPTLQRRAEDRTGEAALREKPKFLMLVDHCFAVRGQGTVFTGTVVGGSVSVGDSVLVPELQETRKVKSLQVFRKPVTTTHTGDRVGLCVAQFDPAQMERGVLCGAGDGGLTKTDVLVAHVHRVRFHPLTCGASTKFHITLGHTTVMGTMRYFSRPASQASEPATALGFDLQIESQYEEDLGECANLMFGQVAAPGSPAEILGRPVPEAKTERDYFAVVLLEQPIYVSVGSTIIAMRLDVERENFCRIAIAGKVVAVLPSTTAAQGPPTGGLATSANGAASTRTTQPFWRSLPIVRKKQRTLRVDRVVDARTCIADGVVIANANNTLDSLPGRGSTAMKDKDTMHAEAQRFVGLEVLFVPLSGGEPHGDAAASLKGKVDSTFGKTGKVKLTFTADVFVVGVARRAGKQKNTDDADATGVFLHQGEIVLPLKKYPLALHSSLLQ